MSCSFSLAISSSLPRLAFSQSMNDDSSRAFYVQFNIFNHVFTNFKYRIIPHSFYIIYY